MDLAVLLLGSYGNANENIIQNFLSQVLDILIPSYSIAFRNLSGWNKVKVKKEIVKFAVMCSRYQSLESAYLKLLFSKRR